MTGRRGGAGPRRQAGRGVDEEGRSSRYDCAEHSQSLMVNEENFHARDRVDGAEKVVPEDPRQVHGRHLGANR